MNWKPLRVYFLLAFGITWGVGGLSLLVGAYRPQFGLSTSNPLYYAAAFGPTIAGMIMLGRAEGRTGIKHVLIRALPTWTGLRWYLAVIAGFPAGVLVAALLTTRDVASHIPRWNTLLLLLPFTLVTDPGPLGEEFGWRGFALPRLFRLRSPLVAALMLGVIWAVWHLPTFFISALPQSQLSFPIFLLNSVALSVIMTWLYLRTGGDLLVMILVHWMANYCAQLGFPFNIQVAAEVVCACLIVATGGLRAEPPLGVAALPLNKAPPL